VTLSNCPQKKRVNCGSTVAKVLVVLVKSRVCMGRFYNLKKESLRVFVVVGGRGIDYGWIVKRLLILVEEGKRTRVGNRPSQALFFCFISLSGGGLYNLQNRDVHYRRYVAAKLRSDGMKGRTYGK